ncbi:RND family efflux transporter MFP subunit [Klebsiella pneumoniae]|nr:RND family efflux transporter MFP subunit [Klebsiella pneumoniae]
MDQLTVKRYQKLLGTKYISQQDYDTAVATAQQSNAAVVAAKAAVETARINLAYTKVTSPISGRIGKSAVTKGRWYRMVKRPPWQPFSSWIRSMLTSPSRAMISCA